MNLVSITMIAVPGLPLLVAGLIALSKKRTRLLRFSPWVAFPGLILAIVSPVGASLHLPWLLFGTELGLVDESGRLFLLFTAVLWLLGGLFAQAYISDQSECRRFFIFFLLSMTGNMGLILAQDLVSFYLFFALMSFSSYGLVVHERSAKALYAGKIYIILVLIGEVSLFAAMVLASTSTGSIVFDIVSRELALVESRDQIILLATIGFGIKAGILGLHVWLPLAHPVAPTPASAVLSGAMIKSGLLGWLRILPLGEVALLHWGETFMYLGLAAVFYGAAVGLTQRDPKTLLAYSSISQMGIITMAVGLGLSAPGFYSEVLIVISLYALHHGLSKGALFLGVGVIRACSGVQRRGVWLILCLPALALAGAPLTSGMVVKAMLKAQVTNAPGLWVAVLKILLPWGAVATSLLMGRFLFLLAKTREEDAGHSSLTGLMWPWMLLVTGSVALPWWLTPESQISWSTTLLSSFWPVLCGIVLTCIAILRARKIKGKVREGFVVPCVPPGDLLVPISRILVLVLARARFFAEGRLPRWRDACYSSIMRSWSVEDWWRMVERVEVELSSWGTALVLFLLLGLMVAWQSVG